MIITIDGPTASGKSSVARVVAKNLGYLYLSSGLLYRALAYVLCAEYGATVDQLQELQHQQIRLIAEIMHQLEYRSDATGYAHILYKNRDITPFLKSPEVDKATSLISPVPEIRQCIFEMQHQIASGHDAIVEGRDVGTVVFPDAPCKIFLTARAEVRAQRWLHDQQRQGSMLVFADALQLIQDRDQRDTNRQHSPLRAAPDAWYIDSSDLPFQSVVDMIEARLRQNCMKAS